MWSQEIEEINNNMHEFDLYSKLSIFVLKMSTIKEGRMMIEHMFKNIWMLSCKTFLHVLKTNFVIAFIAFGVAWLGS
jgi:hypothetical protein